MAGGTDLWPNMKRRHQKARTVVSLMRIPGLQGIDSIEGGGDVRIGATTILEDIVREKAVRERYPAFARAVRILAATTPGSSASPIFHSFRNM